MVLTILFLVALLTATGAVLDVGAWFRADRKLQATTDAAALAGAHHLPDDSALAAARAVEYGTKNGDGVDPGDVSFETRYLVNDTIVVETQKPAYGVFTKLFGVDSVTIGAKAKARSGTLGTAKYVAPIVVHWQHPMLQCTPPPGANGTTLDLLNLHQPGSGNASGAFGLINLNKNDPNGNIGAGMLADWMLNGYQEEMSLGKYYQAPSSNYNNSQFLSSLNARLTTEILFPIYRTITGSGQNAQYDIIGWVGFVPTSYKASGNTGSITGSFKRVIWAGIPATNSSAPRFGAYAIALVE
jgi:hypothetical protein